jgi:hypothetical protein
VGGGVGREVLRFLTGFFENICTEFTNVFITVFNITQHKCFPTAVLKRISHPSKIQNKSVKIFLLLCLAIEAKSDMLSLINSK